MARSKFDAKITAQSIVDFASDESKDLFLRSEPALKDAYSIARMTLGHTLTYDEEHTLLVKGYVDHGKRTGKGDWLLKTFSNMENRYSMWIQKFGSVLDEHQINFLRKMAAEYAGRKPYTADDREEDIAMIDSLIERGYLNRRSTGFSGHLQAIWITGLGIGVAQKSIRD